MSDRGNKKRGGRSSQRSKDTKNNNRVRNEAETSRPTLGDMSGGSRDEDDTYPETEDVINASLTVNVSDSSIYVNNTLNSTKDFDASKSRNDAQDVTTSNESGYTESESPPETSRSAPPDLKDSGEELSDMVNLNAKNIDLLKRNAAGDGGTPTFCSTPKPYAESGVAFEDDNLKNGNVLTEDVAKKTVTFADILKQGSGDYVITDAPELEEDLSNSVYFSLLKSPESAAEVSVSNPEEADVSNLASASLVNSVDVSMSMNRSELDFGSVSTRFDGGEATETLINVSSWDATAKSELDLDLSVETEQSIAEEEEGFVAVTSVPKLQASYVANVDDAAADEEVDKINTGIMLPSTVTELTAPNGVKVYVVGTAHFSEQSQRDVLEAIEKVQPTLVVLELCSSRRNILTLDEETILRESADLNLTKVREAINQSGAVQGALHLILLSMSAHLTKKLGMAPGGEFRAAVRAVTSVPGCMIILGDRPFKVTLSRALSALTLGQKIKLAWQFVTSNDDITKDEIERCKEKDLLEKLMLEMTGEFPAISNVFVNERDAYLAHSLWLAATSASHRARGGPIVGVVGMGHVSGITKYWGKTTDEQIDSYMIIPEPTLTSIVARATIKYSFYLLVGFGTYKLCKSWFNFPREGMTQSVYDNVLKCAQALPSFAPKK